MRGVRRKRARRWLAWTAVSCVVLVSLVILFLGLSESRDSRLRRLIYDENEPTASLNVATVAMSVDREPDVNLGKMTSMVRRIVREEPNVELIVFGESTLGWFYSPPDTAAYQRKISEAIPGRTTQAMSELARGCGIYICFGMTEASGEQLFNSQVLIGPEGKILAIQRKKNLRSRAFSPGPTPVAWADIKGVRAALVICFDIQSGETRRLILGHATDLVILSNADWTDPWDRIGFSAGYLGRRFRSWIVSANRVGREGPYDWDGHIEIIDPLGALVASGRSKEQFLYSRLRFDQNPSAVKRAFRSLYGALSLPYFVGRHLPTAFGYMTAGAPHKAWIWTGALGALLISGLYVLVRRPPWKRRPGPRRR
jgi:predicted amidohydrolase